MLFTAVTALEKPRQRRRNDEETRDEDENERENGERKVTFLLALFILCRCQ